MNDDTAQRLVNAALALGYSDVEVCAFDGTVSGRNPKTDEYEDIPLESLQGDRN